MTANAALNQEQPADHATLYEIAERCLPGAGLGGYALPEDVRFIIHRGEGSRLFDVEGHSYIDYCGGAGATIIGNSHPAVVQAAMDAVPDGLHFFGTLNDRAVALSEVLVDAIPCAEQIIYATTGSEATFYGMRIARAATGKNKVLKFEGAYHGNHDYAVISVFPTAAANYPYGSASTGGVPTTIAADAMLIAPYNDLDTTRKIVEAHKSDLAMIIVEPIQRMIVSQPGFLQGLRDLCDEHGIILMFDEVVTGFRLAYGGAQEHFGVTPDMASYGKIVGGGGPIACLAGKRDLLDLSNPKHKGQANYAYINGTLHGNPVAAATGLATLAELRKPGTYEGLNKLASDTLSAFQGVLDKYGIPAIATGEGSLWQFLFMAAPPKNHMDMLASDQASARALDTELLRRGLYILPGVRRFFNTALTDTDIEQSLAALEDACAVLTAKS